MKQAKIFILAIFLGLILPGCNKSELSPLETLDFGFGGENTEGQLVIQPVDSITVDLPTEYQTVTVELKPINPLYSNTPETKAAAEAALVNGEWSFGVRYAEDDRSAIINVSAEYPMFTEALLSVTVIDIQGVRQEINKVLKRDVSEDYEFNKATKTYTVKSLKGLRMVNKLLYAFINDESDDNDNMNVLLACDINFHEKEEDESQNWVPIADRTNPEDNIHYYQGTFDGAGHTIGGIEIYYDLDYVGMFGKLGKNAVVKNLILGEIYVEGVDYVGAIAGWNRGIIMDCEVYSRDPYYFGIIDGGEYVGGLVGYNSGTIIRCKREGCHLMSTISGTGYDVGGLVGCNDGLIDQCSVEGKGYQISSDHRNAGGLVGFNFGVITNSSVKSSGYLFIVADGSCGGLVGGMNGTAIMNCSVSDVRVRCRDNQYADTGAIIGTINANYDPMHIVGCYAKNVRVYSDCNKGGIAGDIGELASVIACFSYQNEQDSNEGDNIHIVEGQGGIFGVSSGSVLQSYYQGAESSPLFGIDTEGAELATNWDEAIIKMNEAIDKYNETAEVKCESKWSGSMTNPVFVKN